MDAREIGATPADEAEEDRLADSLKRLAGADLSIAAGPSQIRTVEYRKLGRHRGTITVHAVRYAASITGEAGVTIDPEPLRLAVPLPEPWEFVRATMRAPGHPVREVAVSSSEDLVRWTAPPFEYYSLTVLELSKR